MIESRRTLPERPPARLGLFVLRAVQHLGEGGLLAQGSALETLLGHAKLKKLLVGLLELLHSIVPGLSGGDSGRLHGLSDFDGEGDSHVTAPC